MINLSSGNELVGSLYRLYVEGMYVCYIFQLDKHCCSCMLIR